MVARLHQVLPQMANRICKVVRLPGLADYGKTLELQRNLAAARVKGQLADDVLLLVEHPRVITLGRGASIANITASTETLASRGVIVHEIERGGDVTYHGPGQLVGYPILDLRRHRQDLHWYLRRLEDVLITALTSFGLTAGRIPSYTGVWIQDRKIASIGVHVTRWVTFHGFALNVATQLEDFDLIVPCGIEAVQMTSIVRELGQLCSIDIAADRVSESFGQVFDLTIEPTESELL